MNTDTVLLLHGIGSSALRQWVEPGWVELFESSGRPVVAPDLPGHGESPRLTDPSSYAGTTEDFLNLIRQTAPVDGVGFSAGGQLLLSMASSEPGLFRRIAVIGVGHRAFHDLRDDDGRASLDEHSREVLYRLKQTDGNDPDAIDAFVEGALPVLTLEMLGHIRAETLLVIGDGDFTGDIDRYARLISSVDTRTVEGLDHFSATDDRRVIRAVFGFITG